MLASRSFPSEYGKRLAEVETMVNKVLREHGVIAPTSYELYPRLRPRVIKKLREFWMLCLVVHEMDPKDDHKFLLLEDLLWNANRGGKEHMLAFSLLTQHKSEAFLAVQEGFFWKTERSFFGYLSGIKESHLSFLQYSYFTEGRVKKSKLKRGYHDHGSRRPGHKWLETADWSFTELQNVIEKERQVVYDTADFLRGWVV